MINRFLQKIKNKWSEKKFVCVGLDKGEFGFDKKIIDQTADLVCAYKPNSAFYEANELEELEKTIKYINNKYPDIPVILDAKRGDVENTNEAYSKAIFDQLQADAVTVSPFLGKKSLEPFLQRKDRGIMVLIKTSNPGAGEFQDLMVNGKPLYQVVAKHVKDWNKNGNVGAVVGATYPEELKVVREIIGDDMPILIPGVGAQGGDVKKTVKNGLNSKGHGIVISSSRGIIFAPNPRAAALSLHQEIVNSFKS